MTQLVADRFKTVKRLDGGSLTEVWLVRDFKRKTEDLVVLKILGGHDNVFLQEIFRRETEALSQINHPNVVRIYDWGYAADEKRYWIALEYIEGNTLDAVLKGWYGGPDIQTAASMMCDLVEAVSAAHAKGIIHRDLKPSNVMVDNTGTLKVVDFGIAKIKSQIQQGMTVRGFGTPPYASPEQLQNGAVDNRSDIYSLGAVFLFILTGQAPDINTPLLDQVRNSSLQDAFKEFLSKMVDVNPDNRIDSALKVKRVLSELSIRETKAQTVYYVKLTQLLINTMMDCGLISIPSDAEAVQWLTEELNSTTVTVEQGRRNAEDWLLYTHKHLIVGCKDSRHECLVLKTIREIDATKMVSAQEHSTAAPATWRVLPRQGQPPADADIESLFELVMESQRRMQIQKQKDLQLKGTIVQWENILKLQKRYLLERFVSFHYRSWDVSTDGSTLEVRLVNAVPLSNLLEDQALLMSAKGSNEMLKVGTFSGLEGMTMRISLGRGVNVSQIRDSGEITLDNRQVGAALKRQADAIRATRYGESKNSRLLELINNPNLAEQKAQTEMLVFANKDLDSAKKEAVRDVLCSELYTIQGPPGTGKTMVISEIIAQLLKANPKVRILLTSQSNTAVDNALEAVTKLLPEVRLLRIGRIEKIAEQSHKFLLDKAMDSWKERTARQSNSFAKSLSRQSRLDVEALGEYTALLQELRSKQSELEYWQNEQARETKSEGMISSIRKSIDILEQELSAGLEMLAEYLEVSAESGFPAGGGTSERLNFCSDKLREKKNQMSNPEQIEVVRQEWLKRLGKGREFEAICARECAVIGSTCLGVTNIPGIWDTTFDWVIVDEAGRATPPEILVPLVHGKRMLLVGDHKQLPPVFELDVTAEELAEFSIEEDNLTKSLFEEIFDKAGPERKKRLNIQYRMHPGIGRLVSDVFYEGTILNAESTASLDHGFPIWPDKSVVWVSTSNRDDRHERKPQGSSSRLNVLEARLIHKFCEELENALRGSERTVGVGIISGYAEQKKLLERTLSAKDKSRWQCLEIEIDNVDAFQGRQKDVIIYSVVCSNNRRDIGFLKDERRLNVALSRARLLLLLIGDHEHVQNAQTGAWKNPFPGVIHHIRAVDPDSCSLEVSAK